MHWKEGGHNVSTAVFDLPPPITDCSIEKVWSLWVRLVLYSRVFIKRPVLKSDNLQYNKLGRWVDGTKHLMFQALFFFIISYRLYFYFCKIIKKNKKINWNDFCKEFCKKL